MFRFHAFIAAGFWYSALYVVIEGWQEVGFTDPIVDPLLANPLVQTLKRYRHGVCHFQRNFNDPRFMDFINDQGSVKFVTELHQTFFRWFRAQGQLPLASEQTV